MKLFKKNESGRSMVEMLGVLAIIGVLSVGGIAGYRMAMKKNVENDYLNFIQYLKLMRDVEFQNEENAFSPYTGSSREAKRARNEILCTYLPGNYCQEYVNPINGAKDSSYFMGDHFYWQNAQYNLSFSSTSSEMLPYQSEYITFSIDYRNHHPDLVKDVDLCKNLVNAIANTFGEQFGGFNYKKMGISKDSMLTYCEEGVGMQPFNIIISLSEE